MEIRFVNVHEKEGVSMSPKGLHRLVAISAGLTALALALALGAAGDSGRSAATDLGGQIVIAATGSGSPADLYLVDTEGSVTKQLTSFPGYEHSPGWSPSRTDVVFAGDISEPGNLDIYILSIADGSVTRLTSDSGADGSPAWSPDGTRIAYVHSAKGEESTVWVLDPAGKRAAYELPGSKPGDSSPNWSPDSGMLALRRCEKSDERSTVAVVDSKSGELVQRLDAVGIGIGHPVWSPDGASIAVSTDSDGGGLFEIAVSYQDGALAAAPLRPAFATEGQVSPQDWTSDGRILVYLTVPSEIAPDLGGGVQLHIRDVGTGQDTVIALPNGLEPLGGASA